MSMYIYLCIYLSIYLGCRVNLKHPASAGRS